MSNDIRNYQAYLDVLEMLLLFDERIADSYFSDFSRLHIGINHMDFDKAYKRLKRHANGTYSSPVKDRIIEVAILLKLNPELADTRSKYWVEQIQNKSEREAYYMICRDLKKKKINLRIILANKQEALSWLTIMMNFSMEYADLYYKGYAANIISVEEYRTLKNEGIQKQLYGIAFRDPDEADQFYRNHAANRVSEDDYFQIKKRAIRRRLQSLLNYDISKADVYYTSYGQRLMPLDEYRQIKRPILVDLLEKACAESLARANMLFEDKANGGDLTG